VVSGQSLHFAVRRCRRLGALQDVGRAGIVAPKPFGLVGYCVVSVVFPKLPASVARFVVSVLSVTLDSLETSGRLLLWTLEQAI
jgi:uncharacterized ParB-like nuclease family protein